MAERRRINPGNLVRCRYKGFKDEIGFVLSPSPTKELDKNHVRVMLFCYKYHYSKDFHWFEYEEVENLGPPTDLEKIIYDLEREEKGGFSKFFKESLPKYLKRL